jgi:hypothetical protein
MIAELKHIHSPDVDDLSTWTPEGGSFSILLQVIAGPAGSPGEESFDVTLCTPAWIETILKSEKIIMGRHLLIVMEFDYDRIYSFISKYVSSSSGNNWSEIASKLARLGHWEFEDYNS